LIDDVGFGQFSTFAGGVPSPTMDRLAAEGLRFNHFHTTALCSPTRASLITGRNHHATSFAGITELATGYDGYTCILPKSCGTVGEMLRQNGYMTAWIGKNHNTPTWETSAAGPFDRWANGLGFDYFYGFNGGDMNHWNPILFGTGTWYRRRKTRTTISHPTSRTRRSPGYGRPKRSRRTSPSSSMSRPGTTHAPHHVAKPWIEKFKGQFDGG
jgi:arylsulfatase A-like enzyme